MVYQSYQHIHKVDYKKVCDKTRNEPTGKLSGTLVRSWYTGGGGETGDIAETTQRRKVLWWETSKVLK